MSLGWNRGFGHRLLPCQTRLAPSAVKQTARHGADGGVIAELVGGDFGGAPLRDGSPRSTGHVPLAAFVIAELQGRIIQLLLRGKGVLVVGLTWHLSVNPPSYFPTVRRAMVLQSNTLVLGLPQDQYLNGTNFSPSIFQSICQSTSGNGLSDSQTGRGAAV